MVRATTKLRRRLAAFTGLAVALGTLAVAPRAEAQVAPPLSAIVVEGRGFGHGIGLSQYGAYGLAVEQGWPWQQILDLYYGGTALSPVQPSDFATAGNLMAPGNISVRLIALDGQPTSVLSETGQLSFDGDPVPGRQWGSLVAREVGNNVWDVFGTTSVACAPPIDFNDPVALAASGWVFVRDDMGGPVSFATPTSNDLAAPVPSGLVGVCEPSGSVRYYRGSVRAVNDPTDGSNHTVNELPHEWYLRGVVPRESPSSWGDAGNRAGMNALRAQAVAARSYSLAEGISTASGGRYAFAKTCDTQSCQVYGGAALRQGSLAAPPTVLETANGNQAVDDTAGQIRRSGNGKPTYAMFSSSNGGRTAGIIFPKVDDIGDGTLANANHLWSVLVSAATIQQKFPQIGTPTSVVVTQRDGLGGAWNGYALKVAINGTASSVTISGDAFRTTFGVKSSWFEVSNIAVPAADSPVIGRTLLVGDSVAQSLGDEVAAMLAPAFPDLQFDGLVNRCTVGPTCGGSDALTVIKASPTPQVAIVMTGYNDDPATFGTEIDQVMTELNGRGVLRVVWVGLSERRPASASNASPQYAPSNQALRDATTRWPNLTVLDWNAYSSGGEKVRWFSTARLSDGRQDLVHLTTSGQVQMGLFLRQQLDVLRAAGQLGGTPPAPPPPPVLTGRGIPLVRNERNAAVRMLQAALKARIDRKISVNGTFDTRTWKALRTFEARNRFPVDGRADGAVLRALGIDPTTALTTLRRGDRGAVVRSLQTVLRRAVAPKLRVDGTYGTRTVTAIRTFQLRNRLPLTGVADPVTLQRLGL